MSLALSRQFFGRDRAFFLLLCRNEFEKAKVDCYSYTCTLNRLEEEEIQPLSLRL